MNFSLFSKKYERSEVVEVSAQEMLAATNKLRAVNAEAELKRTEIILQATNGKRSFELARTDRLNSSWVGAGLSFNQEIRYAIGRLQALSRDLAQNDPYVKKFLTTYSNYIIGPESFTVKNKAYDWGKNDDGSQLKTYDT
jgi:hypothetical protein